MGGLQGPAPSPCSQSFYHTTRRRGMWGMTWDGGCGKQDMGCGTCDLGCGMWDMGCGTWDLGHRPGRIRWKKL